MHTHRPAPTPRVLLVSDSLDVGGAERHVVELAAGLVRAGWSATIACSTEGGLAEVAHDAGVEVRPLLKGLVKRRMSLSYAWQIARYIRRERFDLVHAHMYASAGAAALATTGTRIPLVVTDHSEAAWRRTGALWWSRYIYDRAARVIAVSEDIRHRLMVKDSVPGDKIVTVPNACPSLKPRRTRTPQALLHVLQSRPVPVVAVIARLQPEKGVQYFVEAAADVLERVPQTHFLVVGDGPLKQQLQLLARRLDVYDHFSFLGFRLDIAELLLNIDVLVVPSLSEGTPLVILEAMSASVPVVASAVGGIPEQIRNEREGLLVTPRDSQSFAAAISSLLVDPSQARRLGQAAHARGVTHFSPERLLDSTQDVYRTALRLQTRAGIERLETATPPAL